MNYLEVMMDTLFKIASIFPEQRFKKLPVYIEYPGLGNVILWTCGDRVCFKPLRKMSEIVGHPEYKE